MEAQSTREEAQSSARRAEQARLASEEQAAVARRERETADELERRAAEVDPDVEDPVNDDRDLTDREREQARRDPDSTV